MTRGQVIIVTMSQIRHHARSAGEKQARADAILDAARELEQQAGFSRLAVADIARRAGIAKGTFFLYFTTKEAVGLGLLEAELRDWLSELERAGRAITEPAAPQLLARTLAATIVARPALVRLLALQGALERNVEPEVMRGFRSRVLVGLRAAGGALELALASRGSADGFRLLQFVQVVVIGLQPFAELSGAAHEVLSGPELASLRIDFAGALESALRVHLEGLRALRTRHTEAHSVAV
jgi:AcrR family transcriptional regulator